MFGKVHIYSNTHPLTWSQIYPPSHKCHINTPFLRVRYHVKKCWKVTRTRSPTRYNFVPTLKKKSPAAQASDSSGFRIEVTVQNLFTTISSKTCTEHVQNLSSAVPSPVWLTVGHGCHLASSHPSTLLSCVLRRYTKAIIKLLYTVHSIQFVLQIHPLWQNQKYTCVPCGRHARREGPAGRDRHGLGLGRMVGALAVWRQSTKKKIVIKILNLYCLPIIPSLLSTPSFSAYVCLDPDDPPQHGPSLCVCMCVPLESSWAPGELVPEIRMGVFHFSCFWILLLRLAPEIWVSFVFLVSGSSCQAEVNKQMRLTKDTPKSKKLVNHCLVSRPAAQRHSLVLNEFAGIPAFSQKFLMFFSVIPGNPLEMEFLYQEKEFVAGCVWWVELAHTLQIGADRGKTGNMNTRRLSSVSTKTHEDVHIYISKKSDWDRCC